MLVPKKLSKKDVEQMTYFESSRKYFGLKKFESIFGSYNYIFGDSVLCLAEMFINFIFMRIEIRS
jgi:hypothetical protein